ncbi:MAG: hypothetical protein H6636_05125 [Anaerolineales bacterium]|nr:hypothetical protein [Anaerolineales bacterium]
MKTSTFRFLILVSLIVLGVTACATLPAASSTETPQATEAPTQPLPELSATENPVVSNPVEELARQALASQLGISVDSITVQSLEAVDWRNGCLEVNEKGVACTDVIVPGYRILLEANGQTYEYRSNLDGSVLLAAAPVFPVADSTVEELARTALAQQLGIAEASISLVSMDAVDWPDGCLGVNLTDIACITVITPGYRIVLQANGQTYEYHTNKDGSQMLLATTVPVMGEVPTLQVDIQGGIAGFCDHVTLYLSGLATYQSCNVSQETRYQLTATQLQTLQGFVSQYGSFEYTQADPAAADQMTVQFIFNGMGTLEPTPETYQQMQALATEIIYLARGISPDA